MTELEKKQDANQLMDLEMMDTITGGMGCWLSCTTCSVSCSVTQQNTTATPTPTKKPTTPTPKQ